MESKTKLQIALLAAMVAKAALEMIDSRDILVVRLCAQDVAEKFRKLLKVIDAATELEKSPVPPYNNGRSATGR